ncbi:MAG: hypothetical protein AB1422_01230 [bacterium]
MGNFSTSQDSLPFSYTFSFYIIHFTFNRTGGNIFLSVSLRLCGKELPEQLPQN